MQNFWCCFWSLHVVSKDRPQLRWNVNPDWGLWWAGGMSWLATTSVESRVIWSYQVSFPPPTARALMIAYCHHFFGPCLGCVVGSSPNRSSLDPGREGGIHACHRTKPAQAVRLQQVFYFRPPFQNCFTRCSLHKHSNHCWLLVIPRIEQTQWQWESVEAMQRLHIDGPCLWATQ